jgi:cysteinyl-tRNA synthetase
VYLYNSLTKEKSLFQPIQAGKVSLYVCGMTVYDHAHIGHARPMVVFDVFVRYLQHAGYSVRYVRNITDIDDKIIQRARSNGEEHSVLTERFIEALQADEEALGLLPPTETPRATAYCQAMIDMISELIDQQHAYVNDHGDVCFSIRQFPAYGRLSHRDIDALRAGVRADTTGGKRDPLDFVLWKLAKPGEPAWPSPWGEGRPGWHIECSAMARTLLGKTFDIHGGGLDLKFPHHENEIAQSEAVHGCAFARHWMHVGLVNINGEKMSKSLGNFLTIQSVLAAHPAEVLRYFMISAHYRSPLNYTEAALAQAKKSMDRLYAALRDLPIAPGEDALSAEIDAAFSAAMTDDLNTPVALSVLFDCAHRIESLRQAGELVQAGALAYRLRAYGQLLGLLHLDPEVYFKTKVGGAAQISAEAIEALLAEREQARAARDFARADAIRAELAEQGVLISDAAGKTTWRMA